MRKIVIAAAALAVLASAPGAAKEPAKLQTYPNELNFYRDKNYSGDDYLVRRANSELVIDWLIGSIGVNPGDTWEICPMTHYRNCMTITESIPDAAAIGITAPVQSARLLKKKKPEEPGK
jgi:hypothetical protein